VDALIRAGLRPEAAGRLIELGGGHAVRGDAHPDGALWLLAANGVDLRDLENRLRAANELDGLTIDVARQRLRAWIRLNRRSLAAVVAQRRPPDVAKTLPDSWETEPNLRLELDPAPTEWLGPVTDSLREFDFDPNAEALANDAVAELIRLAGFASPEELEASVEQLYDPEEQQRILRASAAAWRSQLALLGILARTKQGDSRAAVRGQSDTVEELLPVGPPTPAVLRPSLDDLFAAHPSLASALAVQVTDALSSVPEKESLLAVAREHGLATDHLEAVERALQGPRRELAHRLRRQITELETESLRPELPAGLTGVQPDERDGKPGRKKVAAIKVTPSTDARKRRLGDEGERWALAAVLGELLSLDLSKRRRAIEAIVSLLDNFAGSPVEKARAHAEPACEPDLEEEELIDELTKLLHVSGYSDGFGFDLLGWLPPDPESDPIALCLEVKSTSDGRFHLSRNEWESAKSFRENGDGNKYAVLVVHRASGTGPPRRLDLLPDPVSLVETGQLTKKDDSYELAYQTG
jgi:hypothetical protein